MVNGLSRDLAYNKNSQLPAHWRSRLHLMMRRVFSFRNCHARAYTDSSRCDGGNWAGNTFYCQFTEPTRRTGSACIVTSFTIR